jgi:D-beta-D-heptose 7-phosphate kinase/D-beta-D-heptose 1-phosphate adenosyltransferase|tara:strand:- start:2186 stop:2674 length:489 start_codon:yes stop_codon:yes gene_type:complete
MITKNNELKSKVSKLRLKNKKIVFTNGCFDILHLGHQAYLKESRALGDFLIVAINSDKSVKLLKGSGRPINGQDLRSKNLMNLKFVDAVAVFSEQTPLKLIEFLLPDVLTKGGDYAHKEIIGSNIIEANGGRVVLLPFLKGYSTTSIIKSRRKGLTDETSIG